MYTKGVLKNENDEIVKLGDKVTSFRGEQAIVLGWSLPRHAGSSGRVFVQWLEKDTFQHEYFPSVFDLHIEEV